MPPSKKSKESDDADVNKEDEKTTKNPNLPVLVEVACAAMMKTN